MSNNLSRTQVNKIKEDYPVGTRIMMTETMNDPQPILKGEKGTVMFVDDMGLIHMKWDNGRGLAVSTTEDSFVIIGE